LVSHVSQQANAQLAKYTSDEKILLHEHGYTIQVLGARTEKTIKDFIAQHGLSVDKAHYCRTSFKGKQWYKLLYGHFTTRTAAKRALQSLPTNMRTQGPWVTSLKPIQTAVRSYHKTMTAGL
jgi:DamX protein